MRLWFKIICHFHISLLTGKIFPSFAVFWPESCCEICTWTPPRPTTNFTQTNNSKFTRDPYLPKARFFRKPKQDTWSRGGAQRLKPAGHSILDLRQLPFTFCMIYKYSKFFWASFKKSHRYSLGCNAVFFVLQSLYYYDVTAYIFEKHLRKKELIRGYFGVRNF